VPAGAGGYRFYDDDPYPDQPWQPGFVHTCTWADALGMDRRINFTHATAAMIERVTRHRVYDTPRARFASDHLPSGTFWTGSR
jgi:hypothetical protein